MLPLRLLMDTVVSPSREVTLYAWGAAEPSGAADADAAGDAAERLAQARDRRRRRNSIAGGGLGERIVVVERVPADCAIGNAASHINDTVHRMHL